MTAPLTADVTDMIVPQIALAVRQPWAWAIIHAGKNVENRTARAITLGRMKPGRIAILASLGMTQQEYKNAAAFMAKIGVTCPPPAELQRGGIIGYVRVAGFVKAAISPWFMGPHALVLADPRPCQFIAARGELGYFKWHEFPDGNPEAPLPWMLKWGPPALSLQSSKTNGAAPADSNTHYLFKTAPQDESAA